MTSTLKKKSTHVYLFLGFLTMFVVGAVFGATVVIHSNTVARDTSNENIIVEMAIHYGGDDVQLLPSDIISPGSTLGTYLDLVENRYGIPIERRSIEGVEFVEAIHGISSTEATMWAFSVNEQALETDPETYILQEGDTIVWSRVSRFN